MGMPGIAAIEADVMSEPTALPPDPLSGSPPAAYWSYGYDMPDDLGGGFVTGELPTACRWSSAAPSDALLSHWGRQAL
jgi:hypothetical protein